MADFIKADQQELTIITNKVVSLLDLSIIEKYIKNVDAIDLEDLMLPWLSQSKSYLKILGILYFIEDINILITFSIVKNIIKTTHIFNDVCLTSKSCVIKALPKSNMIVIQVDIWDVQSSMKAKGLINRCFNVSSYISSVCRTNMNLGIP